MRKNLIAISAVAALGTFGLVGGAAAQMAVNAGGTGHQLVFPYFSSQGDNATSIALVNTDSSAGKVVKVRFRGAVNSDDVLDFQVLMSPGDVWTAAITAGTDGKSMLSTSDASCTVPDTIRTNKGVAFDTSRVDPKSANVNGETREGYIEVINMADIPAGSALFTATKHVNGVAPCTAATISSALGAVVSQPNANLAAPTGRLAGDFILLQQTNRAAWSGSATALVAGADGAAAKLVFWPQNSTAIVGPAGTAGPAGVLTSDPLAGTDANQALNTGFTLRNYDLPDLSTPYDLTAVTSGDQLTQNVAALRTISTINQFETSPGIGALTDVVFTQPLRRYMAAVNYTSGAGVYTANAGGFTNPLTASTASGGNTSVENRQICLTRATLTSTDREEAATTPTFVVSPGTPTPFKLCGEVAVATVNSTTTSALGAVLTSKSSSSVVTGYNSGWLQIGTGAYASAGLTGLPFIGAAFVRASAPGQNYGFTFGNKTSR